MPSFQYEDFLDFCAQLLFFSSVDDGGKLLQVSFFVSLTFSNALLSSEEKNQSELLNSFYSQAKAKPVS